MPRRTANLEPALPSHLTQGSHNFRKTHSQGANSSSPIVTQRRGETARTTDQCPPSLFSASHVFACRHPSSAACPIFLSVIFLSKTPPSWPQAWMPFHE